MIDWWIVFDAEKNTDVVMPRATVSFSGTLSRIRFAGSALAPALAPALAVPASWPAQRRGLVRCHAKKKNQRKKERKYGEGREQIGTSVTESLHFGRLIGETAKDTAERLEGSATGDARAKLYLEKWEQEEDASYSMFESLLNGKPLDDRSKKMKEIEFESILELSTDDEVFQEYELVLSSGDEASGADGVDVPGVAGRKAGAMASKVCYSRVVYGDTNERVTRGERIMWWASAVAYTTGLRIRLDTVFSEAFAAKRLARWARPSAPRFTIMASSGSWMSLMLTSLTVERGMLSMEGGMGRWERSSERPIRAPTRLSGPANTFRASGLMASATPSASVDRTARESTICRMPPCVAAMLQTVLNSLNCHELLISVMSREISETPVST